MVILEFVLLVFFSFSVVFEVNQHIKVSSCASANKVLKTITGVFVVRTVVVVTGFDPRLSLQQ